MVLQAVAGVAGVALRYTYSKLCYFLKSFQVLINIKLLASSLVLHNKPWMFQCNYFFEEIMLVIQLTQVAFIFASAETKANICYYTQSDLFADIFDDKTVHGSGQWLTVIIIIVPFFTLIVNRGKAQRTKGVDIEFFIKCFRATKGVDHFINKN